MIRSNHRFVLSCSLVFASCSAFVIPAIDFGGSKSTAVVPGRTIESCNAARSLHLSASSIEDTGAATNSPESAFACNRKPREGDIVTVRWNLEPCDGLVAEQLFDTAGTMSFVLHGGNYLPGLHELVSTMTPGESVENKILDAGWGERREELVAKIPKDGQSGIDMSKIKVGTELMLSNGVKCVVTEISDTDFTIDANPPLAGASYSANVTLISVEEGPKQLLYGEDGNEDMKQTRFDVATFALGCFWGGELEFMRVPGVVGTKVGYTQGDKDEPTYKEVCSGTTGHTEAIQIVYDPEIVSYDKLVHVAMDRLDDNKYLLNQVGNDRGTQYRHGIYYHSKEQREAAQKILDTFGEHCKTELEPARTFYSAEDYHQQYLLKGGQSAKKGDGTLIRCYG